MFIYFLYVQKFEVLLNHPNTNISNAAKIAIETIKWRP